MFATACRRFFVKGMLIVQTYRWAIGRQTASWDDLRSASTHRMATNKLIAAAIITLLVLLILFVIYRKLSASDDP